MNDIDDSTVGNSTFAPSQFSHPEILSEASDSLLNDHWDKHGHAQKDAAMGSLDSDGSSVDTTKRKERHEERQKEARERLLEHSRRALALFGNDATTIDTPKPPVGEDTSPTESEMREQAALESFSSALRNSGVEVLKLNRWKKYQTRFLTVSREGDEDAATLPRALLWQKHFDGSHCTVAASRVELDRGGVMFGQLKEVVLVESSATYPSIPRRMRQKFPEFIGVSIVCAHGSTSKSHLLCFRTSSDADSFCTAMRIILGATNRTDEMDQSQE